MRSIDWRSALGLMGACVLASGCGSAEAAPGTTVRDSAGVAIVEVRHAVWDDGSAWQVPGPPLAEIGGIDESPEYALYDVRGALRLDDGRILVADAGSSELKLYDGRGTYLEAKGRAGAGPGEFGRLWSIARSAADSLVVWDAGNARLAVHDADGDFVRSYKLRSGAEATMYFPGPRPLVLRDGSILGFKTLDIMNQPEGIFRPDVEYVRFSPTGEKLEPVLSAPFREWFLAGFDPGQEMQMSGRPTAMTPLLFGRESHLSVGDGGIWVGRAEDYTLELHAPDGTLLRRVENRTHEPVPVEPRHVEAEIEERLESYDGMVERMGSESPFIKKQKENLTKLPTPDFFPPYQDVRTSLDGYIWVQEYARPGTEPTRWTVFDPQGRLLGGVDLPEHFEVFEIGSDYVLGKYADEFEVEYVRLYELVRSGAASHAEGGVS